MQRVQNYAYDASAKESNTQPSLNDCLNPGPTLQNLLWSILVRARFLPVLLTGDLEKAFLQVRIKEKERDALRFHWKSSGSNDTVVYRFTRALFGLTCSPFLRNEHLKSLKERYPHLVEELQKGLYVDDLMTGGTTTNEVREKKTKAVEIFEDATFKLHKWHSNVETLESDERKSKKNAIEDYQSTFAKQQLGPRRAETKLPSWLSDKTKWPPEIALQPSQETTEESKHIRHVQALSTATPQRDEFDELLESYRLRKVLRIGAWIQRFIRNCRSLSADREYGPLKTNETEHQTIWWIQRVQQEANKRGEIEGVKVLLNLQLNDTVVLECRGRIAGSTRFSL